MLVTNENTTRENEGSKVYPGLSPFTSDNGCKKSIRRIAQLTIRPIEPAGIFSSNLPRLFTETFEMIQLRNSVYNRISEKNRSHDSSIGIATGYSLDGCVLITDRGKRVSFTSQRPDQLWGPHNLQSNGCRGLFPQRIYRPGRETNHWHSSSAEVKNGGAIPPFPICLHVVVPN
jgi:hypothetical protein